VVYVICEGIGDVVNLTGLHIITLSYCDYKFNLYDIKTDKCLLSWDGDKIRRSGYIKSLVFVEAGSQCHYGPGLLWMHYPIAQIAELHKDLNR